VAKLTSEVGLGDVVNINYGPVDWRRFLGE
jgi:hypothetical protein